MVMQAAAMGLPSIVTDINGCNEIISGVLTGCWLHQRCECFDECHGVSASGSAEVDRMAKNARPLITSRYEQQVVWEAILEEYRGLMGR